LAEASPDALLPDLADSLSVLSMRLGDLGRHDEALKAAQDAVELLRTLAEARPDAFLWDLSNALHALSIRLGKVERHEEAQRAAEEAATLNDSIRTPP
jgi:tetratricopeptide (TPR) repeat protein